MNDLSVLQAISAAIIPLILAITWHELAHAWMAFKFGDYSVESQLSFNPVRHADIFGTILFPVLAIVLGAMLGQPVLIFGWAKPIEINAFHLKHGKLGMTIVSLAGPIANIAMALIWAIILKISFYIPATYLSFPIAAMAQYGILINISVMLLNLLPILPLDGGRLLLIWLPYKYLMNFLKINRYLMIVILVLMITGVFNYLIDPVFNFIVNAILYLINH